MSRFAEFFNAMVLGDGVLADQTLALLEPDVCLPAWVTGYVSQNAESRCAQDTAALVAYVIDGYWEHVKNTDPLGAVQEIAAAGDALRSRNASHVIETGERIQLHDAILTSARMLRFLYGGYASRLRQRFIGCYTMGSLNYGRFHSVSSLKADPSDLDLFLVLDGDPLRLQDLLCGEDLADSLDRADRHAYFATPLSRDEASILNYKLFHRVERFVISVNLLRLSAFEKMVRFDSESRSTLYWDNAMNGQKIQHRDPAGRPFGVEYVEEVTPYGRALTLPNFVYGREGRASGLGSYCAFANQVLPRIECVFASGAVAEQMSRFRASLARLVDRFRDAGMPATVCNIHKRQPRFSPLFEKKMNCLLSSEPARDSGQSRCVDS